MQEPPDAAAWILDHGTGGPGHVGQLIREAISQGLTGPRQAAQVLYPVARQWNLHLDTLLGEATASKT